MKILKIRFKNLNSLEGEWEIDFSHPAYTTNGIFAITGPTGAGKTTLLDAICLALYGRTPRLKILSKSVNEVMTRQTGECFAEVIFVTLKGIFRCHWSHHRARKKPEGELQQPRHEIVDQETNVVLENMIKNVAASVEDVTGMSFDQFTRSIMLAQGSFAAFLQASADERAPLLEQITGTEIYSRISQKVHHHTAEQQRKYNQLAAELDGLAILSEAEKNNLESSVGKKLTESEILQKEIESTQKSIAWLKKIDSIKLEIQNFEDEFSTIQDKLKDQESRRAVLQKAKNASLYVPQHQHLQRLNSLQKEETEEIYKVKQDLLTVQDAIKLLSKQQSDALVRSQKAEEVLEAERKIIFEVKTFDAQIHDRNRRRQEEKEKNKKIHQQKETIQSNITSISAQYTRKSKERDNYLTHLKEQQCDSILVEKIAVFKEKNEQLQIKVSRQYKLQEQLKELQQRKSTTLDSIEKIKELHVHSLAELTTASGEYSSINEQIKTLGKTHPQLYQEHAQLTEHLFQFEKLETLLTERGKTDKIISEVEQKIINNTNDYNEAQKEEQSLREKCVSQEQIVAQQEQILILNRRIKSYEEERSELRPGLPCPLCGATAHPFSEELPPETGHEREALEKEKTLLRGLQKRITELQTQMSYILKQDDEQRQRKIDTEQIISSYDSKIEEICTQLDVRKNDQLDEILHNKKERVESKLFELSEKQKQLEKLDNNASELQHKIEDIKERHLSAEHHLNQESLKLENLNEKHYALTEEIEALEKIISLEYKQFEEIFSPFGYSRFELAQLPEILEELELRKRKWLEAKEKVQLLEEEMRTSEQAQHKYQALLESVIRELKTNEHSLEELTAELATLTGKRQRLYGDKNPDSEEEKFRKELSAAIELRDNTSEQLRNQENKVAFLTDKLQRLVNSTSKNAAQLHEEQRKFASALEKDGFVDVNDFTAAIMSEEKILELDLFFKDLDENAKRLDTLLQEKRKVLLSEVNKELSSEDISTLQDRLRDKNTLLNQLLQEIGKLQGKLEDNENLLREQQNRRNILVQQELELLRWQKLDELIGSASGKKFRNFAQGITFEIMVEMANKNLQKMSDRYVLIRDATHPLNLQIIDNYRAGDIRSTQNLSGGESFLVSLALALGLSNMAGSNVRVDSFFLDEGFGTLDEETLDIALQTLAGLQQDGKMIGIISHISLLKERLDTQIQLVTAPGGHSVIEGPGVRSL